MSIFSDLNNLRDITLSPQYATLTGVEQIKKKGEFKFEGLRLGELALGNFDIEHIESAPLLFQTGYLTIKNYDPRSQIYELGYPNKEVESSLLEQARAGRGA